MAIQLKSIKINYLPTRLLKYTFKYLIYAYIQFVQT